MFRVAVLLLAHAALIALAATDFTIVSWLWRDAYSFQFNSYSFSSRDGWGQPYVSDYSLAQVLTYVVSYALGLAGYHALRPFHQRLLVGAGYTLCLLGLASFALELSHWGFDHHRSLIANVPSAAIAVALLGVVQMVRGALAILRRGSSVSMDAARATS